MTMMFRTFSPLEYVLHPTGVQLERIHFIGRYLYDLKRTVVELAPGLPRVDVKVIPGFLKEEKADLFERARAEAKTLSCYKNWPESVPGKRVSGVLLYKAWVDLIIIGAFLESGPNENRVPPPFGEPIIVGPGPRFYFDKTMYLPGIGICEYSEPRREFLTLDDWSYAHIHYKEYDEVRMTFYLDERTYRDKT